MSCPQEIPIGAIVELRNSKEDWRLVSYWDNEVPRFCRQYVIKSLVTGSTRRAFKHELFEKATSSYEDLNFFFKEQMSQEIVNDFEQDMSDPEPDEQISELERMLNYTSAQPPTTELPAPDKTSATEPPAPKRFKTVTHSDIDTLASKTTEATTNHQTKWAVKLLKGA